MDAGPHQLFREAEVVIQGVEILFRVAEVAGVAERALGQGPRPQGRLDGGAHPIHVVVGIEDAEDVEARRVRFVHEGGHHLWRVRAVADHVLTAQEHLQADVGQGLPETGEPLPRVLVQEAQGHVEGGPAPYLRREQPGQRARDVRGDSEHVEGAHPGGEKRLVGVAHRRVRDLERGALAQPAGEALRAEFLQPLAGAGRRFAVRQGRELGAGVRRRGGRLVRAVDGGVGEEI